MNQMKDTNAISDRAKSRGCSCVLQGGKIDRWYLGCSFHPWEVFMKMGEYSRQKGEFPDADEDLR